MAKNKEDKPLYRLSFTVAETAKVLGVSKKAVYQAINEGMIPIVRIGPTTVISRAFLEERLSTGWGHSVPEEGKGEGTEVLSLNTFIETDSTTGTIMSPEPNYLYPEWFSSLETLDGFKKRSYTIQIDKIRLICEEAGIEPQKLCEMFSAYWPIGRIRHGWIEPVKALLSTIIVQIAKIKREAIYGEYRPNPETDTSAAVSQRRQRRGPANRRTTP